MTWIRAQIGVGVALWVGSAWLVTGARAQDTRQVVEPKIPTACVQLEAKLKAVDDKVAPADESNLDTERIQKALDGCAPGKAVELKTAGGNNAFLTGPLE